MKTILFLAILMIIPACIFSQDTGRTKQSKLTTNYLKKAKRQQAIACGLLGGGALMGLTGFLVAEEASGEKGSTSNSKIYLGGWVMIGGITCMVGSIPLFIIAGENKRKARAITIKMQQINRLRSNSVYTFNYPALTFKIGL